MINGQLVLRKPHKGVSVENLDFGKTRYPSFPFVVRKLRLWLPPDASGCVASKAEQVLHIGLLMLLPKLHLCSPVPNRNAETEFGVKQKRVNLSQSNQSILRETYPNTARTDAEGEASVFWSSDANR